MIMTFVINLSVITDMPVAMEAYKLLVRNAVSETTAKNVLTLHMLHIYLFHAHCIKFH